jgi:LysM repeat protein
MQLRLNWLQHLLLRSNKEGIMKLKNKLTALPVAFLAAISFAMPSQVNAAKGDQGVDWSKYQGSTGVYGYAKDKFGISQIGGYYDGSFVPQSTYSSQVASLIAAGKRAHTYIYSQFSSDAQADQMLNYYLPRVQTPKGSIVALDVESGSPNTSAVMHALAKVKAAGYTAVLYGYKNFLTNHLDLTTVAASYPLWLAEYPSYSVTPTPNYNYFPSFANVGIFQFTSTYIAGGLDGNVDLTGITDNGYGKTTTSSTGKVTVKPKTTTAATKAGSAANKTKLAAIKVGDTVKINLGAKHWATGQAILPAVKGKSYKVIRTSGSKVLLGSVMSWIARSNIEILATTKTASPATSSAYTVRSGDSWWSIATAHGMSMYTLAARNCKTINSMLHPGNVVYLTGGVAASHTYYTVRSGDTLRAIAAKYGTTYSRIASLSGISNANYIYVGERLTVK